MTRHELKEQLDHDSFTDAVTQVFDYATSHRQEVIRWVTIGVAVLVIVGGAFWYFRYRASVRQHDLNNAFAVAERPVGPAAPGVSAFATEDAKNQAVMKAFSDVVSKDGGSSQGLIAEYYLGTLKAKKGDIKGAEADLSRVSDSNANIASLAKIALAQLYAGGSNPSQAQSLLESIINKPTDLVSKEQAQILLARLQEKTNPQQAKKLLQSVTAETKDPTVSRVAQQISGQMAQ